MPLPCTALRVDSRCASTASEGCCACSRSDPASQTRLLATFATLYIDIINFAPAIVIGVKLPLLITASCRLKLSLKRIRKSLLAARQPTPIAVVCSTTTACPHNHRAGSSHRVDVYSALCYGICDYDARSSFRAWASIRQTQHHQAK